MKAFASLNGVTAMTRHPYEAWMVEKYTICAVIASFRFLLPRRSRWRNKAGFLSLRFASLPRGWQSGPGHLNSRPKAGAVS